MFLNIFISFIFTINTNIVYVVVNIASSNKIYQTRHKISRFYIFIILIANNFYNDNSIDMVLTLILMTTFLMIMFFYVVFVLRYRIVMCEEKIIYVKFFKKRQVEYKNLKIKYGVQNVYIYINKHKIKSILNISTL